MPPAGEMTAVQPEHVHPQQTPQRVLAARHVEPGHPQWSDIQVGDGHDRIGHAATEGSGRAVLAR